MSELVELRRELQRERAGELAARVRKLLAPLTGEERALDSGCGTGALAYALAPLVAEVVGVDAQESYIEAARAEAPPNCTFEVAEATALPFPYGSFDLSGCLRVLHHVRRPELVVSELARVTRPGGRVLLGDQLGPVDPMLLLELDRFERMRDPSHERLLPDGDIRALIEANDLVVTATEVTRERRDLPRYLALAGVPEEERARLERMAPPLAREVEVGWYVARKRG
jgi:SAM-dependent methyltransferase